MGLNLKFFLRRINLADSRAYVMLKLMHIFLNHLAWPCSLNMSFHVLLLPFTTAHLLN